MGDGWTGWAEFKRFDYGFRVQTPWHLNVLGSPPFQEDPVAFIASIGAPETQWSGLFMVPSRFSDPRQLSAMIDAVRCPKLPPTEFAARLAQSFTIDSVDPEVEIDGQPGFEVRWHDERRILETVIVYIGDVRYAFCLSGIADQVLGRRSEWAQILESARFGLS